MKTKRKQPLIRFKGFNGNWEEKKLGAIADVYDGTHQTPKYKDKGVKFLSVENISDLKTEKYISIEDYDKQYSNKEAEVGDVLMTRIGNIGTTNIIKVKEKYAYYVTLSLLKPKHINGIFLEKVLNSDSAKRDIWSKTLHIAFPKKINLNEIKEVSINKPHSDQEQLKIGILINNLDKLISLQEQKLKLLEQVKKGLLQKLFPKKGSKVPEIRFRDFEGEWENNKVSDIFKVTRGNVLATSLVSKDKTEKMKYPVYSSQTLNKGLLGYYDQYLYENAITWTTDGANAGNVNFRSGKFYCTNVCGVLLSDKKYSNAMVSQAINRVAYKYVSRVGNPKLMNNVMAEIRIKIPSDEKEIEVISNLFNYYEILEEKNNTKLQQLQAMKQSLLQQMFL